MYTQYLHKGVRNKLVIYNSLIWSLEIDRGYNINVKELNSTAC